MKANLVKPVDPSRGDMKLSIILPCYNAADTVGTQLEALANQDGIVSPDVEVIFVENGSRDTSRAIAEQYLDRLPNLHIVDASAHRGRPQARNAGAKAATGDVLLFCDADDEVAPGWLTAMSQAFATHEFVACRFDVEKLNYPWLQQARGTPQQDALPRLWYPPFLLYGGGSSLGITRALHQAVGGFDETLPFLEDAEYCVRVQQHTGKELHFVRDAMVHIRHRTSLAGLYSQARSWGQYNQLLFKRYRSGPSDDSLRWRAYIAEWLRLLRYLSHSVRNKEGRVRLIWQVGWQIGILKGALRYRVPPVSV